MTAEVTESKWIRFHLCASVRGRKTYVWDVVAKEGPALLGRISWWGPWRKYAFFPMPTTLFEPTCLRDIASFIDARMAERRAKAS